MTIPSKMKGESEFGSGLVICLVKFAEHAEKWLQLREEYAHLRKKLGNGCSDIFGESGAVSMFFNGASDHLYRIEVPERFRGTELERKVTKL